MNHLQQILEDPNILRTTSSCTDNYSGDSFDMYNFQISLLGGQGGPLTYCQFTFLKKQSYHHRTKSTTQLASGCHQLLCASSRLMTRMARPRVRFTWSLSESGGKKMFFLFSWKKSSRSMEASPLPPTKKRENIRTILNEFWGSNVAG